MGWQQYPQDLKWFFASTGSPVSEDSEERFRGGFLGVDELYHPGHQQLTAEPCSLKIRARRSLHAARLP